jgi:arylsulfatase A-like enzyme
MGPAGAVRAGNYKLVEVFEAGKAELYHLRNDLGETHDLAASMPDLAAKLTKMLCESRFRSGVVMATENPDYKAENDWRSNR